MVLMSIGGTATTVLDTAVQALTTQGITVVVAAGNSAEGQASETNVAPCTALVSCPCRVTAWHNLQQLPTQPREGLHCLLSRHAFCCVPSLTGVAVAGRSAADSASCPCSRRKPVDKLLGREPECAAQQEAAMTKPQQGHLDKLHSLPGPMVCTAHLYSFAVQMPVSRALLGSPQSSRWQPPTPVTAWPPSLMAEPVWSCWRQGCPF